MKPLAQLACSAAAMLMAPQLLAADPGQWTLVAADSELTFSAYYEGEELPGRFTRFAVTLETSSETGEPTALLVEVQAASADMNDREVNAEIVEPAWFDAQAFPIASFASQDIQPAENDGFLATGRLGIKGIEQPLKIPLNWTREGDRAILTGSVRLSRLDWQVGTGEWSNDASLADRVDVRWRVTLVPGD
ncbi:MAG: YceI family protein [Lysobacterales bacterium]